MSTYIVYVFLCLNLQPSYSICFVGCSGDDGSQAIQTNTTENSSRVFNVGTYEKVLIRIRDFCILQNYSGNDWDRKPVLEPEIQNGDDDVPHSRFHDGLENPKITKTLSRSSNNNNKATKITRKNAHFQHVSCHPIFYSSPAG